MGRITVSLILLYLGLWDVICTELSPLDDYILHHEALNYDTTRLKNLHTRRERSVDDDVRLQFTAYGRTFRLKLRADNSVFKHDHELEFGGEISRGNINLAYRGEVLDSPRSSVYGTIINGIFRGEIHEPGTPTFHIEPSDRFFEGIPPYHSVIYSEEHLQTDPYRHLRGNYTQFGSACGYRTHGNKEDFQKSSAQFDSHTSEDHIKEEVLHRYRRATVNGQLLGTTESPNTCYLELQSDPFLWQYMKKSRASGGLGLDTQQAKDEIMSLFVSHVNSLNEIFRETRFNTFDNQTWYRGITFIVQRSQVMIWEDECSNVTIPNKFCSATYDVNTLLYQSSLIDHSAFCLSYLFTYRDFQRGTLGLAWVGKPSSGLTGGICEPYRDSLESNNKKVKKSLNTGVVSLLNYGKRVPVRVSQLTFAHEVGHSFGAEHDATEQCAPFKTNRPDASNGNYIMFSSANPGNMVNNNKFSPCSRDYIAKVIKVVVNNLENKRNCFKPSDVAYCGNTIVEEGEECDCGFEADCNDDCCTGRSESGTGGCTLKTDSSGRKYQCSPSQGRCCTKSCTFVPRDSHQLCSPEEECARAAYCNGTAGSCPAPVLAQDNQFCDDNSHVCEKGQCIGSICKRIGWEECFLTGDWKTQSEEMCYVSCKDPNSGNCVSSNNATWVERYPAYKQLLQDVGNGTVKAVQLPPGSPCRNYDGYCDVFYKCRQIDTEGALKRLLKFFGASGLAEIEQWIQQYWWAVLLMCVGLIAFMAVFIKVCSYSTPTYPPGRKPRRQQKEIRDVNPLHDANYARRRNPQIFHTSSEC
ncbi:disintegrin and metalloproteinase domain-containing protein 10-like isoform X2 [Liolophura sinensis]|uniref:disintegrin and metalloproteinase domain-containing protein 10-like isoform X2 n=1 Tax=Liolophura sinensis TaxID=3198878 RepID=UPI003158CD3A